jgi:RimJ/RimL family protein N-acetyltransferase
MPGQVYLDGDRVELRVPTREDVDFLNTARNHPDIREPMTFTTPSTREDIEEFYDEVMQSDDNVNLVVCLPGEGPTPIGAVVLFNITRHHAELAYWLLPEYQGEGHATEAARLVVEYAFETLGLHRVHAKTVDDNEASQALLERLGFAKEGRRRDHVHQRGSYHDYVYFGLLREEFEE